MKIFDPSGDNEPPLLLTKISVPQIPPDFVHRPRLTALVERGVKGPLALLLAPAGYGKTNLLIEWARASGRTVAWLTLGEDDNDAVRFYRYLIGTLQQQIPRLGEEALEFLLSVRGEGQDVGLTLLLNEIAAYADEIVLVLDELHVLKDAKILAGLEFLLLHLPQNFHLVLAGRDEPPLGLASIRAKGWVIELGANDLRFSSDEIQAYFQQVTGVRLTSEALEKLEERTDGWITGLQMTALTLRNRDDPLTVLEHLHGDTHYLVDFLAREVLDRLPEEYRQFLLYSSILNVLSGPLCEAVVNPDAQPGYGMVVLNRLEHANLFITALDERREWFRYHHLFGDFLRHKLAETDPNMMPVLHQRAALWFEQHGNLEDAFQHALACGDVEWAADRIEANMQTMAHTGQIFSLDRWIGGLPEDLIHRRPWLALAYAWSSIAAYNLDQARYWIDDLQRVVESDENIPSDWQPPADSRDMATWSIRGGLAICQSTLAILSGDMEQAAAYSRLAAEYLNPENLFINSLLALDDSLYHVMSGDTHKTVESLRKTIHIARRANNLLVTLIASCELAEVQVLMGHLSLALANLEKARYIAMGPDGRPLPLSGLVDVVVGEIFLERNLLTQAEEYLERGSRLTASLWPLSSLDGMISLIRLRRAQGDETGAAEICEKTIQLVLNTESSEWDDVIIYTINARYALLRGDLSAAEQWWRKAGLPAIDQDIPLVSYPYHVLEFLLITRARFLLLMGKDTGRNDWIELAESLLAALLVEAEQLGRMASRIEILLLLGMAHAVSNDGECGKYLLDALALGEPEGYQRIYLDEGDGLMPLIKHCATRQKTGEGRYLPSQGYLENLLGDFERERAAREGQETVGDPSPGEHHSMAAASLLSAREIEVLSLIAEGKSNQEISQKLFLAVNTVKRHAYNIYAKLDVKNRTQAVTKGRELGLIE